jgi:hypothetical protein
MRAAAFALALAAFAPATARADGPVDGPDVPSVLDVQLGGGLATASGVPGAWATRLQYDAFFANQPGHFGPIIGVALGVEYWRAGPGTWGTDLPASFIVGVRGTPLRAALAGGFDAILVDRVRDDTGVGFYAPFASASAGLDVAGFTLLADARVTRRWQLGADSHTQWMYTLSLGHTLE